MPKRNKNPLEETFLVLNQDGIQLQRETYIEAFDEANRLLDNGDSDVMILKVVKAWSVEYPEEPEPVAVEMGLEVIV